MIQPGEGKMADQNHTAGTAQQNPAINITPAAVAELKRLKEQEKNPGLFVRVGVASGGCSGMSYSMAFDDTPHESDHVFDYDGLTVRVHDKALAYLDGAILDYKGGLLGGGFQFENPNARRSCGCGTSFTC
jgi:iron-sulfur cluster assembly protein